MQANLETMERLEKISKKKEQKEHFRWNKSIFYNVWDAWATVI